MNRNKWLCLIFSLNVIVANGQIRINEMVNSNSEHFDIYDDTPDWVELKNFGSTTFDLTGWSLSDKMDKPGKWHFESEQIEEGETTLIWCSGRDIRQRRNPRTLVSKGDECKYFIPSSSLSDSWKDVVYDDGQWLSGKTSIGYGDGDDETIVPNGTRSVFLRHVFSLDNTESIERLILDMDYDDGFVAYINGTEIAKENLEGDPPAFYFFSEVDREATLYQNQGTERFDVDPGLLQVGNNVLSIQIHNISTSSSDMTIVAFLTAIFSENVDEGIIPPEVLNMGPGNLHTNFKLSSDETIYLFDENDIIQDSISGESLCPNVSKGRIENSDVVYFFTETTPGSENVSQSYSGLLTDEITFSKPGGIYEPGLVSLSIGDPDCQIRWTEDGSVPDEQSELYTENINLNTNKVIRAKIFKDDFVPSKTQSETYLIRVTHDLPILSIMIDPVEFDNENGMFGFGNSFENEFPYMGANFWEDWERPIHFSYFTPDGNLEFSQNLGMKIFGGWSRAFPQKSLSMFARKSYGSGEIDYPLFSNRNYDSFQAFNLRNSGNDWLGTMFRDALMIGLMEGSGLDLQAYQPCVTYMNGEYWGIYNMREKINEHYISSKHDIDTDDINLLELDGDIVHGTNIEYEELKTFLENNSLVSQGNYEFVTDRIDEENFIMYNLAQIYFDNTDWPGNNIKFWNSPEHKWRWLMYDLDFGFGIWVNGDFFNNTLAFNLEANGPDWPNPPWSTLLFRKLMDNSMFRNKFVNQYADEMNTRFLPANVAELMDTYEDQIDTEMADHNQRWDGGSLNNWRNNISRMKRYSDNRQGQAKNHVLQTLNLPDFHRINMNNSDTDKGSIQLNSILIESELWSGDYFENVPIKLTATPYPNHSFLRWEGDVNSNEATIEINMQTAMELTAVFAETVNTEEIDELITFIYPNPTSGKLNIEIEGPKSLLNDLGQVIMIFNEQSVDISNLSRGSYYIETLEGRFLIIKE